jgi:microcystin-dependent protein
MGEPFIAEIKMVGFNFAPKGWALCNGQLLPISQNQALFSILGTTYGGDGRVTFALPNLQGRTPIHVGNGHTLGEQGGEAGHTLLEAELSTHSHPVLSSTADADTKDPANRFLARTGKETYAVQGTVVNLHGQAVAGAGSGQPHNNLQPYQVLNFVIALQGLFPSRN